MRSTKISGDAAVAVFLQFGLAAGIVLLSLARGFGFNLESLLFGSILLVNFDQIIAALVIVYYFGTDFRVLQGTSLCDF